MAGSIHMEQKGCESIGCYTYFVTLSYDLDLGLSRSNFKNAVSREWEGRLTWNQRDVSRWDVIPIMWPWAMTLTLDFEGQI